MLNTITSWFLKRRISQIQEFVLDPEKVQERVLSSLISAAQNTELGKQYHFSEIKNYEQFAQRVPLTTYEAFEPYIMVCQE